jgi:hypothetical protein
MTSIKVKKEEHNEDRYLWEGEDIVLSKDKQPEVKKAEVAKVSRPRRKKAK